MSIAQASTMIEESKKNPSNWIYYADTMPKTKKYTWVVKNIHSVSKQRIATKSSLQPRGKTWAQKKPEDLGLVLPFELLELIVKKMPKRLLNKMLSVCKMFCEFNLWDSDIPTIKINVKPLLKRRIAYCSKFSKNLEIRYIVTDADLSGQHLDYSKYRGFIDLSKVETGQIENTAYKWYKVGPFNTCGMRLVNYAGGNVWDVDLYDDGEPFKGRPEILTKLYCDFCDESNCEKCSTQKLPFQKKDIVHCAHSYCTVFNRYDEERGSKKYNVIIVTGPLNLCVPSDEGYFIDATTTK